MRGNRINHFPNKTTFKKGHKRTPESIEKQRQTLIKQFAEGKRILPKVKWTPKLKEKMVTSNKIANLKRYPIGSRRKHLASNNIYYWLIKVSTHGKWKFEHRVIMENFLNRKLNRFEIVHHKDGNTFNNTIENLQLMTQSEHNIFHHTKH